jgi:hypothetical protein
MASEPRDGPYLNMALICDRVLKDEISGSLSTDFRARQIDSRR